MKLEEILAEWEKDAVIDPTRLDYASLDTPKLHSKYWNILSNERLRLKALQMRLDTLELEKYEFLVVTGDTKETIAKGWELPYRGKIVRTDADRYMKADKHLQETAIKLADQKERVAVLEDIIKAIHNRNYAIRTAFEFRKFKEGV